MEGEREEYILIDRLPHLSLHSVSHFFHFDISSPYNPSLAPYPHHRIEAPHPFILSSSSPLVSILLAPSLPNPPPPIPYHFIIPDQRQAQRTPIRTSRPPLPPPRTSLHRPPAKGQPRIYFQALFSTRHLRTSRSWRVLATGGVRLGRRCGCRKVTRARQGEIRILGYARLIVMVEARENAGFVLGLRG